MSGDTGWQGGGRPGAIAVVDVPAAPWWGERVVRIDWRALDQLLPFVDRNVLFRHHWGFKGLAKSAWDALAASELEPALQALWRDAKVRRWLEPAGAYGYFPVRATRESLLVFDPLAYAAGAREADLSAVASFMFPRQPDDRTPRTRDRLCIADYFRDGRDGSYDVIALQVVTAGRKAGDHAQALMGAGEYDRGLRVHGVASGVAEGFAEWLSVRIRRELGLTTPAGGGSATLRGRRYSWGYGACPNLEDQAALVRLLPSVTTSLGMDFTAGHQWDPEQSTAAFVVHHPQATYFHVLERKGDAPLDDTDGPAET
jgi:5-methyltetrahydrofolate--homocysteine methyltransferase